VSNTTFFFNAYPTNSYICISPVVKTANYKTMSSKNFDKFINKEPKGSAKKEAFRQEKRSAKAAARAAGEEARRKKQDKARGIVREEDLKKPSKFDKNRYDSKQKSTKKIDAAHEAEVKALKSWTPNQNKSVTSREKSPTKFVVTKNNKEIIGNATPKTVLNIKSNSGNEQMPLNKFIAHCGVCGRREAAELVKKGLVVVNGEKILEPSFRVLGNEDVKVQGKKIFLQHNLTYILLNKPKDYITTSKDPEGRKTVLDLIKGATQERVYPVGRLDRNTTGVLLLTNDGELAQKLTHPSFEIKKIYEVKLDKPVTKKDLEAIAEGVTLEDGFVHADSVAYIDNSDKSLIGIEIHSGRNRIVRRIFEHLGYDVKGLDRVMFANLTKKNVDRGHWRMLNEKEIRLLKFMNQSFIKKPKEDHKKEVILQSKSTAKLTHKNK
jgi:23S rRNA pseudouridine2605 synthase